MRFFEFAQLDLLEAPLGVPGLFKYKGTKKDRVPILLDKIKRQLPFQVKTKAGVQDVIIDPSEYEKVEAWLQNPTSKLSLKARDDERLIPFGAIIKTKEFGGEEAGSREKIEQGQLSYIQGQLEAIKKDAPYIELQVGSRVVNAASVMKTPELVGGRAPKSDMSIIDENGKSVAWVSLKGRPFRWGGWQHLIKEPEIADWIARIKSITGNEFDPGQSYGLHISDKIKTKIIYGKDFGSSPGISNVDCILIGEPKLEKAGNGYKLTAGTIYLNGELPSAGDEPYIVLRYTNGRRDVGFNNARGETNTTSETRKVKWLDSDQEADKVAKSEPKQPESPDQVIPQV